MPLCHRGRHCQTTITSNSKHNEKDKLRGKKSCSVLHLTLALSTLQRMTKQQVSCDRLRRLTTAAASRQSRSVCQVEPESILISAHISYLKPNYLSGGGSECGKRITGSNFLTVFHSKYGSTLLSFRHTTMESTTDDGWMTTTIAYLVLKVGRQQTGLNREINHTLQKSQCAQSSVRVHASQFPHLRVDFLRSDICCCNTHNNSVCLGQRHYTACQIC